MTYTLVEYFVRHYTLVIDNDETTYHEAVRAAKRVIRQSDVTRAEWLALSTDDRNGRFAQEIGDEIGELIGEWCDEALRESWDSPGGLIFREIALHNDSDVRRALGAHYMPEDADIADLLDDDSDEAGDE